MNIVALTGGIGSGKSEASRVFSSLGVPIVDLDMIAYQLTTTNGAMVPNIKAAFGSEFITSDGAMNRDAMRELVFNQEDAREKLNALLHPAIQQEALKAFKLNADTPYQILDIPLLNSDSPFMDSIHHVLVIDCDEATQVTRVMQRSQLSKKEVTKVISAQLSRCDRLRLADTVIDNNGDLQELSKKLLNFHENYIKTCILSE